MAAVAGGGYMLAAAAVGAASSYFQGQGNRRNMKTAQAWEERMRETRHRTNVEDLKNAGINPMVAYSQGQGGPGGNLSSPSPSGGVDVVDGVSSALASSKVSSELALMKSQEGVNTAQRLKTIEEEKLTSVAVARAKAELEKFKGSGSGIIPNTADFLKKQAAEVKKAWKKSAFKTGERKKIKKRRDESLRAFKARREFNKMPDTWQKKHRKHKHSHNIQGGKEYR